LRYLFQRWAKRLERQPKVRVLTPYDAAQSCGLASFSVEGLDVNKLVTYLWDKHRIIVTPIVHQEFTCVRVTPRVYTTVSEIDGPRSRTPGCRRQTGFGACRTYATGRNRCSACRSPRRAPCAPPARGPCSDRSPGNAAPAPPRYRSWSYRGSAPGRASDSPT